MDDTNQQMPNQEPAQSPALQNPQGSQTRFSGLAIAGFVLSFFGGLIGVIVSIIAYRRISKNPNLEGKGLALAGIIIGSLATIILIIIVFVGAMAYFGMPNPNNMIPDSCKISMYLQCNGGPISNVDQNSITFSMANNLDDSIGIESIRLTTLGESDCAKTGEELQADFRIEGEKFSLPSSTPIDFERTQNSEVTIYCKNDINRGQRISETFEMTYIMDGESYTQDINIKKKFD